jgi:hypothetical protein
MGGERWKTRSEGETRLRYFPETCPSTMPHLSFLAGHFFALTIESQELQEDGLGKIENAILG